MTSQLATAFPLSPFATPLSSELARPFYPDDSAATRAAKVKQLLLDLSKDETDKELKSVFRQTADFFRESFFGLTSKQIRSRITRVLEDYFDGETYTALEIDNLVEQTGIKEDALLPILSKMVAAGHIIQGRRRRWNELGEHYNAIYKLAG